MGLQPINAYNLGYQDSDLFDTGLLTLSAIEDAYSRQEPRLAEYIVKLAKLDPAPEGLDEAQKQGKFTYIDFVDALCSAQNARTGEIGRLARSLRATGISAALEENTTFEYGAVPRQKLRDIIAALHKQFWELLDGEDNRLFLPERVRLDDIIWRLYEDGGAFATATLLDVIAHVPFKYGPWRALKKIFKSAIDKQEWELFGAITARIDVEFSRASIRYPLEDRKPRKTFWTTNSRSSARDVTRRTLGYLVRKAWRTLRRTGSMTPALYVEAVVEVLRHYPHHFNDSENTWVLNHILFHEIGTYSEVNFQVSWTDKKDKLENRAFGPLWRQNSVFKSLLRLMESARSPFVHSFCISALKEDFSNDLEQLDIDLLRRMAQSDSVPLHEFIVWWFEEKSRASQDEYFKSGMHTIIISLLKSNAYSVRAFAIRYVKSYKYDIKDDLPLEEVLWLVYHQAKDLHQLGVFLISGDDSPYELDFDTWTSLLENYRTFELAGSAIRKLSAIEGLSLEWYQERLHSDNRQVVDFAFELLKDPKRQRAGEDWRGFYIRLLKPDTLTSKVAQMALDNLQKKRETDTGQVCFLDTLEAPLIRTLLIHPHYQVSNRAFSWMREELISVKQVGVDFLKHLILRETWEEYEWATVEYLGDYLSDWNLKAGDYSWGMRSNVQAVLSNPSFVKTEDLGYSWIIRYAEKCINEEAGAEFVKEIFLNRLPIVALCEDEKSTDTQAGGEALLRLIGVGVSPDETITRPRILYRQLFSNRYNKLRRHRDANAEILPAELAVPEECLTFSVFKQMSEHDDPHVRKLATTIAKLELSRWSSRGEISFSDLSDIFTTGVDSMKEFIRVAAGKSPITATCRIDLEKNEHFSPEAFLAGGFLYSSASDARDFGIQVLKDYADKFGQDTMALLPYANSADRRVREMVIRTMWRNYRRRPSSKTPYDFEVAANEKAKAEGKKISDEALPKKRKRDLRDLESLHYASFYELLKQVAFRLPATHPIKSELTRTTPVVSTWRNKIALIETLRDIAVENHSFAQMVTPLFNELLDSYGRTESEAAIVALTRIKNAHPDLDAWEKDAL